MDKNMKVFFNLYVFIWAVFGLIICLYYTVELIFFNNYSLISFRNWLLYIFPLLILILYIYTYIKFRYSK